MWSVVPRVGQGGTRHFPYPAKLRFGNSIHLTDCSCAVSDQNPLGRDPRRLLALGSINYAKKYSNRKSVRRYVVVSAFRGTPNRPTPPAFRAFWQRPPTVAVRSIPEFLHTVHSFVGYNNTVHAIAAGSSTNHFEKSGQTRLGRLGIGAWDRRQREYLGLPPGQTVLSTTDFAGGFRGFQRIR